MKNNMQSESNESCTWIIEQPLTILDVGDICFCLEHRSVEVCGFPLKLTAKEFDIFALLVLNAKRVFTYEMITDFVWHEDFTFYSRKVISNHISNIKKKIHAITNAREYIISVYGVGYKFDPDL